MEIWCATNSCAFYQTSQTFFIDAKITKISENSHLISPDAKVFSKITIKFAPKTPREFDWLATWPYIAVKISRVEHKKGFNAKPGQTENFIATNIQKCELSKVE